MLRTRCVWFVIGVVALQLGCAPGDEPPFDAVETATTAQAVSSCGLTPPASPCTTWRCNTQTGDWEDTLKPAGTVCQSTGKCDPGGVCRLPISPAPVLSIGSTPAIWNSNAIGFMFTCGGNATSHRIMRALNGAAATQITVWSSDGTTQLPLSPCTAGSLRGVLDPNDLRGGDHVCYTAVASTYGDSKSSATICYDIPLNASPPTRPDISIIRLLGGARIDITDRSSNETAFLLYTRVQPMVTSSVAPVVLTPWVLQKTWARPGRGGGDRSTGSVLSHTVTGLDPNLSYDVKVEVRCDFAPQSAERLTVFRPLPPVPGAPTLGRHHRTDVTDTLTLVAEPFATTYRLYFVDRAGAVLGPATAELATLRPTVTGLTPSTEYCFVATASNESGASPRSNIICDTTWASAQARVKSVTLSGFLSSTTETPGVRALVELDGLVDFIEVRAGDNLPTLAGLALQPASAGAKAACDITDPTTVFVPPDGVLDGPALVQLYGTEHPYLGFGGGLFLRGCAVHGGAAPPLPPVTVQIHYTGP